MDGLAILMADAFNTTCFRDHIKGTGRPRQDSPYMRPGLLCQQGRPPAPGRQSDTHDGLSAACDAEWESRP